MLPDPWMDDTPWTPLVSGSDAAPACAAIREIATALRERVAGAARRRAYLRDPGLSRGAAGVALFFAELAELTSLDDDRAVARELLEHAIERLGAQRVGPGLLDGVAGAAWAVSQRAELAPETAPTLLERVDALLRDQVASGGPAHYDLVSGLAGIGVYACERGSAELAGAVVGELERRAVRQGAGLAWHTPGELLPPWQRERCPDGFYNLGVAHGSPGIIGFLASACRFETVEAPARALLDGAVSWLLERGDASGWSAWHVPGRAPETARRLAWCYGDLGIAAVLARAARATDNGAWLAAARAAAERAAGLDGDAAGVRDAGLCHGATGASHLFHRLADLVDEPRLRDAARGWLARALALRQSSRGFAGFRHYVPTTGGDDDWRDDPGLLNGAAGIGLALLAATGERAPQWDQLLLSC